MNTYQIGDHLSLIKGISMERGAANLEEGALDFSAQEAGEPLAAFLLGYPTQTRTPEGHSEFFNATNGPYFGDPSGISFSSANQIVPDGSRDGEIRNLRSGMRIIQFGLKLYF